MEEMAETQSKPTQEKQHEDHTREKPVQLLGQLHRETVDISNAR